MAYSDFTLKKVKQTFNLTVIENQALFSDIPPHAISPALQQILKRNLPLAQAINTEKARSELLIINILLEIKDLLAEKISLFSGIDFNVDKEQGLIGFCDYILSASPEQFYLDAPVVTIVEAKNENINAGFGQCIAEMYAAKIYNERENHVLPAIYGAVTTGDEWRFLKLQNNHVNIDLNSYYISELDKILGIFLYISSGIN